MTASGSGGGLSPTELERLAELVHQSYLFTADRFHHHVRPEMARAYGDLSEEAKEFDRATVRTIYYALSSPRPSPPDDAVERIARAICPDWWGGDLWFDEHWQCMRHGLDNYPGQHEKNRKRSLEQARAAIAAMPASPQIDALIEAAQDGANDLEEELNARYPDGPVRFQLNRQYERDMQTVIDLREALAPFTRQPEEGGK